MTARYEVRDTVAIITLDNPPVNSLGMATRRGIWDGLQRALPDPAIRAVVITGAGRAFCGGADIREFATGGYNAEPLVAPIIAAIEGAAKPVVAALNGLALGGGCELALACHYRVGLPGTPVGLPEVKLGILPGAGGTQRLPRLIGAARALELIVSGTPLKSEEMLKLGYFDRLVSDGDVVAGAVTFALEILAAGQPPRRVGELTVPAQSMPGGADAFFAEARKRVAAANPGVPAPLKCVEAVEAAVRQPLAQGLATEGRLCMELMATPEAKALQYTFFAERAAARIPDVPEDTPVRAVRQAAVIGAGVMGGGIAMCFANAGIPVVLLEANAPALERGMGVIRANYEASAKRGRLTADQVGKLMALITPTLEFAAIREADIVIEAVFEELSIKQEIFARLDATMKPGAILATNTSMLDVNVIAAGTRRPQEVIGTHFFSPANVMRLLEVVRGKLTAPDVLATTMQLGRRLGKVCVVAGVCDGFIGNRMLGPYARQAGLLVEEGALPQQVDAVLERFGMAMGPFRVLDLAGLDTHMRVQRRLYVEYPNVLYPKWMDRLAELGRYGQKSGAGVYRYEPGARKALPDPLVDELVVQYSAGIGLTRRTISDEEILGRCLYALVNEGARILEEGFAQRASDLDVVYLTGYGFPAHRGGPMFHADRVGLPKLLEAMRGYAANPHADPAFWAPAGLITRLAAQGKGFL